MHRQTDGRSIPLLNNALNNERLRLETAWKSEKPKKKKMLVTNANFEEKETIARLWSREVNVAKTLAACHTPS